MGGVRFVHWWFRTQDLPVSGAHCTTGLALKKDVLFTDYVKGSNPPNFASLLLPLFLAAFPALLFARVCSRRCCYRCVLCADLGIICARFTYSFLLFVLVFCCSDFSFFIFLIGICL